MSKEEAKIKLPYHADITLFGKMLTDLKTAGSEGIDQDTLWANLSATKDNLRSFTLGLAKFLGLVDSDSKKVWLTNFGTTLRYMSKEERNKTLARKLPPKYLTMFKWIVEKEELHSNELKRKYIETWGSSLSASVLDRVVATFLNYCAWIEIIVYQGRGNQAKAIVTDFGKRILELPPETHTGSSGSVTPSPPLPHGGTTGLLQNATYPIKIKTQDRGDFDWDIKSVTDWAVIDSVIKSIREGWEKTHQKSKEVDSKAK